MSTLPLVIMGVSGSGKSSVAEAVAARIPGGVYLDADALHPEANVTKMAAGHPLTDEDRAPWLDTVGATMAEVVRSGDVPVMACSALRRAYRDRILAGEPSTVFVLLDVPTPELERRMRLRRGHFMPPSLLASQLATLEPLAADEPGITVAVTAPVDETADAVLARLATAP